MSALDPRVCPLISVLCSLEIVKRVVTVKQVQPFRLAGPGHGYAKTPGHVVPAERRLMPWFQGAGHRAQKVGIEADWQCPVCSLISVV